MSEVTISTKIADRPRDKRVSTITFETKFEVEVNVRLDEENSTTIRESFASLEEARAWRDGVVRGFNVSRPLWALLGEVRAVEAKSRVRDD